MRSSQRGAGKYATTSAIGNKIGDDSEAQARAALGKPARSGIGWGDTAQSHFQRKHRNAAVRRSQPQRRSYTGLVAFQPGLAANCRGLRVRMRAGELPTKFEALSRKLAAEVAPRPVPTLQQTVKVSEPQHQQHMAGEGCELRT